MSTSPATLDKPDAASGGPANAIAAVHAREQTNGLWGCRPLGAAVWPLLRIDVYQEALRQGQPTTTPARRRPGLSAPLLKAASIPAGLLRLARCLPAGRDIWVLSSTNYRRGNACGKHECIFTTDLETQLRDRLLYLEFDDAGSGGPGAPAPTDRGRVILDALARAGYLMGETAARLGLARMLVSGAHGKAFAPITRARLLVSAACFHALKWLARRWIRRARPHAAFVLCGYSMHIAFQEALREAAVPVIELQHGLIYDSHAGYNYQGTIAQPHSPDRLVVFGRHFGAELERAWEHWQGRWVIGGHPWLRARVRAASADARPSEPRVAVFGQGDPAVRARLLALLPGLRRALPANVHVVYKPHPNEVDAPGELDALRSMGIEVVARRADSYTLLARSTVAVSVYSTLALEALAFGCRSLVLSSALRPPIFDAWVNRGCLWSVDGAADIVALAEPPDEDELARIEAAANDLFALDAPPLDYLALAQAVASERGCAAR